MRTTKSHTDEGTHDLTHGSIAKELWTVSWPMMLSVFFYTLYNIVDAFWVSKLSPDAIAAVSISQITLFLMAALSMGITAGSGVIMAMNIGAQNKKEAERVLGQSFVLSGIAGIFFTAISLIFKTQLLTASGAMGALFDPALTYFTITAAGSILFFLLITIMFAFNAQADTFTLTKLFALSTLINVVLDPVLIFGYGGVPAMEIAGAAVATLISQAVFVVLAIRSLSSPTRSIQFHFKNLTLKWASVKEVLRIGIPASLTQVINPIGLAALLFISSSSFAEPGAVAFSIGNRIEFLGFLPAVGFGFGAMALIGQNIGAGNIKRAKASLTLALKYGFIAAAAFGLLAIVFRMQLVRIFTTDETISMYSLSYILVVALSYGFMAATMVEANAFQAVGKSWPGFWIFLLKFMGIAIPLSYLFTWVYSFPIISIWIALALSNVIPSIVGYFWINRTMAILPGKGMPVNN